MADHKQSIGLVGGFNHAIAIGKRERHWFFTEHVLTGFECADGNIRVLRRGKRDIDQVDVRISQNVIQVRVGSDTFQVDLIAGRAKVALNSSPVAGQPLGIPRADGGHAGTSQPLVGEPVNPTHEADAYEPDPNHRGASSGSRVERSRSTSCGARPSPFSWNSTAKRIITTAAMAAGTSQMLFQSCGIAASGVAKC